MRWHLSHSREGAEAAPTAGKSKLFSCSSISARPAVLASHVSTWGVDLYTAFSCLTKTARRVAAKLWPDATRGTLSLRLSTSVRVIAQTMKAPPPAGDFADTLCGGDPGPCGCCISDRRVGCVSVLVSWCIPGVVVAQLFQRVTRIPDSFAVIAIFLFGTTITNILLNSLCGDQSSLFGLPGLLTRPFWPSLCPVGQKCAPDNDGASGDDAEDGGRSDVCIFNDWLAFTSGLVLLSLFLVVRARVREQYRIAPCCCGVLEDCFHALWCLPCAASQLMRHVSTHEATEYSLFSADGTKTLDPLLRDARGAEASPARAASIRAEASMRV